MKQKNIKPIKELFIAKSNYGKSYLIKDRIIQLIQQKQINPKRIIIFSQTYKSDDVQQQLIQFIQKSIKDNYIFIENNCFESINYELIDNIYQSNKINKESNKKIYNWLLYFDDQITDNNMQNSMRSKSYEAQVMKNLMFIGRHYYISCIFAFQIFKSGLPSSFRQQLSSITIGALTNDKQSLDIIADFSSQVSKNPKQSAIKLFQYYQQCLNTNNRHGFLRINNDVILCDGKYQINLENRFLDPAILESDIIIDIATIKENNLQKIENNIPKQK